jgi:hypothetical protein
MVVLELDEPLEPDEEPVEGVVVLELDEPLEPNEEPEPDDEDPLDEVPVPEELPLEALDDALSSVAVSSLGGGTPSIRLPTRVESITTWEIETKLLLGSLL